MAPKSFLRFESGYYYFTSPAMDGDEERTFCAAHNNQLRSETVFSHLLVNIQLQAKGRVQKNTFW
jgi:hypothetical protein